MPSLPLLPLSFPSSPKPSWSLSFPLSLLNLTLTSVLAILASVLPSLPVLPPVLRLLTFTRAYMVHIRGAAQPDGVHGFDEAGGRGMPRRVRLPRLQSTLRYMF